MVAICTCGTHLARIQCCIRAMPSSSWWIHSGCPGLLRTRSFLSDFSRPSRGCPKMICRWRSISGPSALMFFRRNTLRVCSRTPASAGVCPSSRLSSYQESTRAYFPRSEGCLQMRPWKASLLGWSQKSNIFQEKNFFKTLQRFWYNY